MRFFRADDSVRLTTTLSTSIGEDYENVESNVADGRYRAWSSRVSEGVADGLLHFR
jgi:hypothetical protein